MPPSVPPPARGWSQWINTLLLLIVCTLLKVGYDDFVHKQQNTNDAIQRVNDKLSAQDLRMQKMEDYENIWLTTLPKLQGADEAAKARLDKTERTLDNHEYRIDTLEKKGKP